MCKFIIKTHSMKYNVRRLLTAKKTNKDTAMPNNEVQTYTLPLAATLLQLH